MNTQASQDNDLQTHWSRSITQLFESGRELLGEVCETCGVLCAESFTSVRQEIKYLFSHFTTLDIVCGVLNTVCGFIAALVCLSGFGVLGYQGILWMQEGVWTGLPLLAVFETLFENTALHTWFTQPESWIGFQKAAEWLMENIPLSLALILPGALATFAAAGVMALAIMIRYYQFKNPDKD